MRLALLAALAGMLGCAGGPKTVEVIGSVAFDGRPIVDGNILFVPTNGTEGQETGAPVIDGAYFLNGPQALRAHGTYEVRIRNRVRSDKPPPASFMPPDVSMEFFENSIPEIFNTKSTLSVTIGAEPSQQCDFDLKKPLANPAE